jgi:hypothetical protein
MGNLKLGGLFRAPKQQPAPETPASALGAEPALRAEVPRAPKEVANKFVGQYGGGGARQGALRALARKGELNPIRRAIERQVDKQLANDPAHQAMLAKRDQVAHEIQGELAALGALAVQLKPAPLNAPLPTYAQGSAVAAAADAKIARLRAPLAGLLESSSPKIKTRPGQAGEKSSERKLSANQDTRLRQKVSELLGGEEDAKHQAAADTKPNSKPKPMTQNPTPIFGGGSDFDKYLS